MTSWYRVFAEQIIVIQLFKKYSVVMKFECSPQCLQNPSSETFYHKSVTATAITPKNIVLIFTAVKIQIL
jgi:hypothetical protein